MPVPHTALPSLQAQSFRLSLQCASCVVPPAGSWGAPINIPVSPAATATTWTSKPFTVPSCLHAQPPACEPAPPACQPVAACPWHSFRPSVLHCTPACAAPCCWCDAALTPPHSALACRAWSLPTPCCPLTTARRPTAPTAAPTWCSSERQSSVQALLRQPALLLRQPTLRTRTLRRRRCLWDGAPLPPGVNTVPAALPAPLQVVVRAHPGQRPAVAGPAGHGHDSVSVVLRSLHRGARAPGVAAHVQEQQRVHQGLLFPRQDDRLPRRPAGLQYDLGGACAGGPSALHLGGNQRGRPDGVGDIGACTPHPLPWSALAPQVQPNSAYYFIVTPVNAANPPASMTFSTTLVVPAKAGAP